MTGVLTLYRYAPAICHLWRPVGARLEVSLAFYSPSAACFSRGGRRFAFRRECMVGLLLL